MDPVAVGRYISLLLRHRPEAGNLVLDANGWCDVQSLVDAVAARFTGFSVADLEWIVANNDKRRYSFDESRCRIRANQGHSVNVDVELAPSTPPSVLYHGTASRFVDSIRESGIKKGSRLYVHLSSTADTAAGVGRRHGSPVVITVDAAAMYAAGYNFYLSANGVWLTDAVPPEFLRDFTYGR